MKTRARGDEAEGRCAGESRAVGARQLKGRSKSDWDGSRDNAPGWQRSHRWWQGVDEEQGTPCLDRSWLQWVTGRGFRLLGGTSPRCDSPGRASGGDGGDTRGHGGTGLVTAQHFVSLKLGTWCGRAREGRREERHAAAPRLGVSHRGRSGGCSQPRSPNRFPCCWLPPRLAFPASDVTRCLFACDEFSCFLF